MQYSVVQIKELDKIVFRLDAEYYQPEHLNLQYKLKQFKSISVLNAGAKLDCSAFYPSIVPYYNFETIGVPFLRVNEIQNGLLHLSKDTAFLSQTILDKNPTTIALCKHGDLIIAKGGNSLAKVALLTKEHQYYSVCRDVIALKTNKLNNINKFYLWMFFHSSIGQKILLRTASQTGQPHLTLDAIKQIEIPLFSNVFQNKFEWLYQESQRLKHESEVVYSKAKTLLLSELGLTSWQPKHQLTFIKKYSDTEQSGRIDAEYYQPKYDDIINVIKNYSGGWDTLGKLCKIKRGSLISDEYYDKNCGVPYIRGADFSGGILTKEKVVYINKRLQHKNETVVIEDEIVFSLVGSVGETALVSNEFSKAYISNNTGKITCGNKINPTVLQVLLNSVIGNIYFEKYKTQTAQPKISDKNIHNFIVPLLPEAHQTKIQQKVTESFNLRKQSNHLLECAKKAVEMAIEQNEQIASQWLENEVCGC